MGKMDIQNILYKMYAGPLVAYVTLVIRSVGTIQCYIFLYTPYMVREPVQIAVDS